MGKPLSRPGCFRRSSCCLEKHGAGDGGVGGQDGGIEGGYGDGYIPQRSIYDTMCINQQIDSHHHHPGGSIRRDGGGEGSFSFSASGSLRVSRPPADMFDPQPRSLTPNPSFVRRLDERAIYDSLKLGGQDADGSGCHSPGHYNRSVSPSMSSFSAPGVSSSSSKKHHHHHHHHHGDSTKSRDDRHSWKVLTPPKHIQCLELTTTEMMDRGGAYLNPGHYPTPGGQSSLTSPLISPFSGSPLSSGYHTPVFFSPAKPRPSQTQSLRCSPPHVIQPRHYSQTQSLRLSPPHELRRSPYRSPLVQLSAHDLEQDLRDQGGGWGRSERDRQWEREREREMERGWAQREWERERERGRLERERAREREKRETSTFGTFGYGRPVPLRSDRDSVFLDPDQVLDTTPLLLPQPSPSPSPSAAPRMGTCAVGRNRAGSKVVPESVGGGMVSKFDNGGVGLVLVESKSGPRLVSQVGTANISEAEIRAAMQEHHRAENWNKYDNGSRANFKSGSEKRMGSQVKTRPGGRELEGKVQSGVEIENMNPAVKEGHRGGTRSGEKGGRSVAKPEPIAEIMPPTVTDADSKLEIADGPGPEIKLQAGVEVKASSKQIENRVGPEAEAVAKVKNEEVATTESRAEAKIEMEATTAFTSEPEAVQEAKVDRETGNRSNPEMEVVTEAQNSTMTIDKAQPTVITGDKTEVAPEDPAGKKPLDIDKIESSHSQKSSRSHKSKSSKSSSKTRPGTATGLRPGVISPRLNRGLENLESSDPAEGIESTWPRRIIVRKRTVRQGGALHNLPILPPLPSVLSALEKRRPHAHLHPCPGHTSDNPATSIINATSIVGRLSLKEPSHPETAQGVSLVGRASLKEQNLEHWRVCREQEESRRSRSKEKQADRSKEKTASEERKGKEEKKEKERKEDKEKTEVNVGGEKVKVIVVEGLVEETKQETRRVEEKVQRNLNLKMKQEKDVQIISENMESKGMKIKDGIQELDEQELEGVVAKLQKEGGEVEVGQGRTPGEEGGMESWDAVLEMVNTLWDDGWEKGGGGQGGDIDSLSGSLQRWPLLRPPVGFGGSHPPSSAASELSLTELERRARELDSDLEHLDLSQPHMDTQDLYQTLLEPQRDRGDIYQTHPGTQRDKAALITGVGSRSQVSLELTAMASPATDTDRPSAEWSTKSAGTSTVGTRESDSESSGSGPVDLSVLGCGSVAGDSDWDSDLSDSDPSRSSRNSAAGSKSSGSARSKQLPAEPGWDLFGDTTEPEVLSELFMEQDRNNNGIARKVTGVTTGLAPTPSIPMATKPVTTPVKSATIGEQSSTTKKVTWQFKPAQRSVCTGSRKDREKEATSTSLLRFTELGGGEMRRPSPSSSSSSSSSPSSSSSG
ncbi:enolase-phosphatase E1-like isoform X2 [Channa argus]|uniref:enolase-phosphatase E1-like isoform X2 n=1 Tax=Channa argus TaxID=215402 RepID=UPI00352060C8